MSTVILFVILSVVIIFIALRLYNKPNHDSPKENKSVLNSLIENNYFSFMCFVFENSSQWFLEKMDFGNSTTVIVNKEKLYLSYVGPGNYKNEYNRMVQEIKSSNKTEKDLNFLVEDILFIKFRLHLGSILKCKSRMYFSKDKNDKELHQGDIFLKITGFASNCIIAETFDGQNVDFWGWRPKGKIESSYININDSTYYKYDNKYWTN